MHDSTRWLILSNALFVLGGILAYATQASLAMVAVISLVAAVPGLMALRLAKLASASSVWLDRAFSFAVGTWAVLAVFIIIPYVVLEDGGALWAQRGYHAIGVATASVGMLLWSGSAYLAVHGVDQMKQARSYALFHLTAAVVAVFLVMNGDGVAVEYTVRGVEAAGFDLKVAPALAAMPGIVWALAFWRSPSA